MEKRNDIVFISFDAPRTGYPSIPYGIACLIAAIRKNGYIASHYSINTLSIRSEREYLSEYVGPTKITSKEFEEYQKDICSLIKKEIVNILPWLKTFRYVAFTYTRWSELFCKTVAEVLWCEGLVKKSISEGVGIIFGGYEITACDEKKLATLEMAHYFTKGYAEKSYLKILTGEDGRKIEGGKPYHRIFDEKISEQDIVSPYLSHIIPILSRKIYWETKRGCPYCCGFCEWGAQKKDEKNEIIELNWETRLVKELRLFKKSGVEEINILDGTFCFSKTKQHIKILEYIFKKTNINVVCQARFEALKPDFLDLCASNKERIHLEFGLQTIHKKECETIGRNNHSLETTSNWMKILKEKKISYEVSLIYAIPGQTMYSFIDSIEYLLINGCKKIRAYPLQIPANNSKLAEMDGYATDYTKPDEKIPSVVVSQTFNEQGRKDMDALARRLEIDSKYDNIYCSNHNKLDISILQKKTEYQFLVNKELVNSLEKSDGEKLIYLIYRYYNSSDKITYDFSKSKDIPFGTPTKKITKFLSTHQDCIITMGKSGNFYIINNKNFVNTNR
ncbi:MAG: hypothetical protein J6W37_03715 [Bacteroidales bacterium]|nr:hypothetical protein [Bacteroidales bacterium]